MKVSLPIHFTLLITIALLLILMLAPGWSATVVSAQVPAAETTVTEQATATFTSVPIDTPTVTNTPVPGSTATNTPVGPTNTATAIVTLPPDQTSTPMPTPVSGPVPIPEPVTVILFGTGLAALSAAVASRRKKDE